MARDEEAPPARVGSGTRRAMIRAAVAENVRPPGQLPETSRHLQPTDRGGVRRSSALAVALGAITLGAGTLVLTRDSAVPAAEPSGLAATLSPAASQSAARRLPVFEAPVGVDSALFPLVVRRVTVDAGHGGTDDGTSTGTSTGRLAEKDLTLDIAERLSARLEAGGYEALLTRTADTPLSLRERVQRANEAHSDLFVSIHVNWFNSESVRGVETYYLGATEDPELMALAQRENRESGYQLADLRQLLDGVYADLRQEESRRFASRVQHALYRALLPISPELRDRGVKTAPFVVLVATEMPAILAEVSCLSNRQEAERLARPRYREHIAEALFVGIEAYARDVNQMVEKGS